MMYRNIMKRLSCIAFAAFFVLVTGSLAFGQVVAGWNTSTLPGGVNNFGPSPFTPTTTDANVTVGGLTRGAGVSTIGTAAARGWGGVGWDNAGSTSTSASNITANKFFTFTVKANTGFTLSLSSINPFDYRRSGTGPGSGLIQYSINGGAFVDITTVTFTSTAATGGSVGPVNLAGVAALQNLPATSTVTFRIVPFGSNNSAGTFYIFDVAVSTANDFALNGTVTAVPVTMPGAFSLSSATYGVGEGDGNATVTVNRTGGSDGVVTVTVNTSDGTATGGASCGGAVDYQSASSPTNVLMFNNGETSKTFNIPICDDAAVEVSETFNVTLVTPTGGATLGSPSSATVTITDNDVAPAGTIQFSSTTYSVGEAGGNATLTVTRTGGSNGALSATYSFADITATGGATCGGAVDYDNDGGTVMFGDGDTADKTITVPICSDAVDESNETFSATLSGVAVGSPASATVTITDDDTTGVTFTETDGSTDVAEGGATDTYSVVLNSQPTSDVTITPSPDSEVTVSPTSLTFTPVNWNIAQNITVTAVDDSEVEGNHTGLISHAAASGDTNYNGLPLGSITANITDNDMAQPGTIVFSMANYSVNEETPGFAVITVNRVGGSDGTIAANYATSDGTATGGGLCGGGDKTARRNLGIVNPDYAGTTGTITFENGDTEPKSFFVLICDDLAPEADETVNLSLTPVIPTLNAQPEGGLQTTAVLTIIDNDGVTPASVQFSAATYEYDEGDDEATITVTRTGNTTSAVTVDYATSNGTANGGSCQTVGYDYQTKTGTLSFASGETSKTFSFEVCSDTQSENPPETVTLTLSNPTGGATLGSPNPSTLRIIDAATQFVNSNPIFIPEITPLLTELAPAVTASSSIVVSGAGSAPNRVRVTLFGFSHPTPDDLDILLVSPTGQRFVLLGDAGGTNAANNLTLTFEDAATTPAPDATVLSSGNYKPANHEAGPIFDAPAPGGPYVEPGPTGTAATLNSTFSANPNGTWTLYLRDDTVNGNTGALTGGFGLEFIAPTAAGVNVSGRVTRPNGQGLGGVVVSLVGGGAGERKYAITSAFGYYTFEDVIVGETYILSVSSKRYTFSPSSLIIDLQDGVADANFVSQQ